MDLEVYIDLQLKDFGMFLFDLVKDAGYGSKKEFGIIFNYGKVHNGIYAFFKGKNFKFNTLLRLSSILNVSIIELLNKEKTVNNKDEYKDVNILIKNLSQNLKRLRKDSKYIQLDLESINKKYRENISRYETEKSLPELITIIIFAYTYNVKAGDLFITPKVQ